MGRQPGRLGGLGGRPWVLVLGPAAVALAAALAWSPVRTWHHLRAGRTALEHYHNAEARACLEACLAARPDDAEAHLLAARAARRDEDYVEAEKHIRAGQRLRGEASEDVVLEWSLLRAAGGDLDDVENYLQVRTRKEPEIAPLVWEALAEGYRHVYRIQDALACLDAWLARQPDAVQALVLRGHVWRQVQAAAKAVPDYRRALELDPTREDARWWLGVCLQDAGRSEEALPYLEAERPRRPEDPDVLGRVARCRLACGEREEGLRLLGAVLAGHPEDGPALRARGQLALQEGRLNEAEDWLGRAARAAPHDYRTQYSLYLCLRQSHRDAEARAQLARSEDLKERLTRLAEIRDREMSVKPRDPALHCEMGRLLVGLGQKDVGQRWLLSALRLDPHFKPAHAALADYYRQEGDAGRAAEHRRQAEAEPARP